MEPDAPSPFLRIPESEWLCTNVVRFAIFDRVLVLRGHVAVIPRVVPTFFNATTFERSALIERVGNVKGLLDGWLEPKSDGCKVGMNAGAAAGRTVPHVHVRAIPRYAGDVTDPRSAVLTSLMIYITY